MQMMAAEIDREGIRAFCLRWGVREFSLFGSILREDFGPGSDVDVLVTFNEGGALTFDSYVGMREELSALFGGREVDLVETGRLADPYRRYEILRTREVVYAE
jgi:uncharacterized protein